MSINTMRATLNLQQALTDLEDRVVLTADKEIHEREYAISEIRYYRKLMQNFFEYPTDLQISVISDLLDMIEEIGKWLNEN